MRIRKDFISSLLLEIMLVVLMSFYYFPVGFHGLPEALNTKQMLAVVGILMYVFKCIRDNGFIMSGSVLKSFFFACLFSIWCYFCCVYNDTSDYAYATYVKSFVVWLSGAFAMCGIIRAVKGRLDVGLVTKYLTLACVAQCALVLMVDNIPAVQHFVDSVFIQDETAKELERLYGIGCSLDSGGVRFCTALLLIAHLFATDSGITDSRGKIALYVLAFLIITVIGNMVSRTTSVGVLLSLFYIFVTIWMAKRAVITKRQLRFRVIFLSIFLAALVLCIVLYFTNASFHRYIRFAFEAFFNFVEEGEFRTDSSDELLTRMWIWPWTDAGWAVGYGLFEWSSWYAYGVQTDIGYCRFTLYCGLIGIALFGWYFIYNSVLVARRLEKAALLAALLAVLTFIVWAKVSTDIFQMYALLLCLPATAAAAASEDSSSKDLQE